MQYSMCLQIKNELPHFVVRSLLKLSKGKWLSLDMYAETIGVILLNHSRNDAGEKKKDNNNKWTRTFLEENVRVAEDRTAWRKRSCAAGAANVRTDDTD